MIPFDLHYLWPEGWYLAPIFLLLISLFAGAYQLRRRQLRRLTGMVVETHPLSYWLRSILLSISWLFALIALMQPVGNGHYAEGKAAPSAEARFSLRRKAHDVIFLLDASASMGADDTPQGKSRLEFAKEITAEIIGALSGESAALNSFTSRVENLAPTTLDHHFLKVMLSDIAINEGGFAGTDLGAAIEEMKELYFSEASPRLKSLILISDGGDTAAEGRGGAERRKRIELLAKTASESHSESFRLFAVGVGTAEGAIVPGVSEDGAPVHSKLDQELLRALAQGGRGAYYDSNLLSPMALANALYKEISRDGKYYNEEEILAADGLLQHLLKESALIYDRYFQWPLGVAIALLALALSLPLCWELTARDRE